MRKAQQRLCFLPLALGVTTGKVLQKHTYQLLNIFKNRFLFSLSILLRVKPVFLLFLVSFSISAQQNLVPNGDFEEYWECPDDATQIERCKYVYNPCAVTTSTSDYFNSCYLPGSGSTPVGIPLTNQGYQASKSGSGMVGFLCTDDPESHYREYIQLSFTEPLKCGTKYHIEGYFNLSELYRYTIKNIGFLFTEDRIHSNQFLYSDYSPQYTDTVILVQDTVNWTNLSFDFVADAPYSFLSIGHFLNDSTASYVEVNPNAIAQSPSCYFFLEDFSIREIGETIVQFPNVITPNGDGVNDDFKPLTDNWQSVKEVVIVNRWGNVVVSLNPPFIWDGNDSKGCKVADGVYYFITQNQANCKKKKGQTGVIHVIH